MSRSTILGLNVRVVISMAVILGLFILLTEVSISELTRVTLFKHTTGAAAEAPRAISKEEIAQDFSRLRRMVLFYLVVGAGIALVLSALAIRRLVIRPVLRVNEALERVTAGRLDTTVPLEGARELAELGTAFNQMTGDQQDFYPLDGMV